MVGSQLPKLMKHLLATKRTFVPAILNVRYGSAAAVGSITRHAAAFGGKADVRIAARARFAPIRQCLLEIVIYT